MNIVNLFADETTSAPIDGTEAVSSGSKKIDIDWNEVVNAIVKWMTNTGIKILISLIVLIIAFKIINFITKRIGRRLERKNADVTVSRAFVSFTNVALKILVIVMIIGYLGFETASLSAVIASLGVGISLAVQGTLSNFAAGIIIIIMRPFKLGDFITSNNYSGTVEDIRLFYTSIVSPDNKVIKIPNSTLANNVIVNASIKDHRRVDLIMSIAYDSDVKRAKEVLLAVARDCPYVNLMPDPLVEVGEYADSSINIFVRVWCKRQDYWKTYYHMLYEMKNALDENHIEIPFNQLDVNIKNEK